MRLRSAVTALLVVAALGVVGVRIWWTNESLPRIPAEVYEQNEWVELDGAFQNTTKEETDHYSLMVEGAQLMTYDEYLETYGTEEATSGMEGLMPRSPLGEHGDARCVVVVALRIRNDGSELGGVNMFQMALVPERANEYLMCDVMNEGALWPQVQQGAGKTASVQPGTEYLAHIPYVFNGGTEVYWREVTDRTFTLLVSRMPERKMIKVTISE